MSSWRMGGFEGWSRPCSLQGLIGEVVVMPVCRSPVCFPSGGTAMDGGMGCASQLKS